MILKLIDKYNYGYKFHLSFVSGSRLILLGLPLNRSFLGKFPFFQSSGDYINAYIQINPIWHHQNKFVLW